MENTTGRNNRDTNNISKLEKQEDGGSTDERETYQMKKGTKRHDERKYDNYSQNDRQNESKLTERLI